MSEGVFVIKRAPDGYTAGYRRQYEGGIPGGERGEIKAFSTQSRRRLTKYIANCRARYRYLGTLTVKEFSMRGEIFKGFIDVYLRWFLARMRAVKEPELQSILWWLEFQARGAPHLHFLYTERVRWELASKHWAKVVGDESIAQTATRFEKIRKPGAMAAYIAKYAAKLEQKDAPAGMTGVGRYWGVRGYREVREAAMVAKNPATIHRMQIAIAKAAEEEVSRGTCTVRVWKYGSGISVIKKKGQFGMDKSGALARMELALLREAANGGLLLVEPLPPE